jgi:hypothetical protein
MKLHLRKVAVGFAAAFTLLSVSADAQTLFGGIVGTATDASNAAVPQAMVTITNKGTGQQRQATTNDVGQFNFVAVVPGTYEVRISKEGFRTVSEQNAAVAPNNVTRVDLTLPVGSVSEAVTVEASSAVLQTDSATVKNEITARDLLNVPVPVGRNYQNLLVTIPGFSPPTNAHSVPTNPSRALQMNVNGAPAASVNVRIDGASSQQPWLPHITAYIPSLEAIETVNVSTNSFAAEQGLAGGAAVNVQVKSGTNNFHGSAFWYHNSNATFMARPYEFTINNVRDRNPKYIFNQPGGTLGGPIVRNKLFFFGAYEMSTRREFANRNGTLPTTAMRSGDLSEGPAIFGNRGIVYDPLTGNTATGANRTPFAGNIIPVNRQSPITRQLIQRMPTIAERTFIENNYFAQGGFLFDRYTVDAKVNYNVTDKWTMYGRYGLVDYTMNNPGFLGELVGVGISGSGGNTGDASGKTHSFTYATTYVLTPNIILDGNFGYTHYGTLVEQPNLDQNIGRDVLGIPGTNGTRRFEGGWPRFTISNFATLGVPDAFMPYERNDPQYQYVANVNWTKGSHQIRFGVDFYQQSMNHLQPEFAGAFHGAQGGFNFSGGPTQIRGGPSASPFNSWASFLLGEANNYGRLLQVPDVYTTRNWFYSSYAQDTWQVNRKLTLNYGVRYEYFPMPTRADRGMERYDFVNNKMLACGVGQVPRDCGTRVERANFAPRLGIAFRPDDKTVIRTGFGLNYDPTALTRFLRTNFPVLVVLNGQTPDGFVPVSNIAQGIPQIPVPDLGNGVIDIPRSYAVTSTGDEFRRSYIMSWNFVIQRELPRGFNLQAGYVANRTVRQMGRIDLNAGQIPGAGNVGRPFFDTFGRTVQTALVTPIGHTKYNSLQTQLTRRFSAGLQLNFAYTFSKAVAVCCSTNNDGNAAIQALAFQDLNSALAAFDRPHNFQASWVYELPFGRGKQFATSGFASALAGGWQVNGLLSAYSGSPFNVVADGASLNMPGNTQRADQVGPVRRLGGVGRQQAFYDWRSFAPVTGARFGTASFMPNTRGPSIRNLDIGVFRRFILTERFDLTFRAEAMNVTNTPQWGNPSNNISNLRTDGAGNFTGGVFEVTGTANTGRDGLVQRVFRFGLRLGF